MNISLKTFSDKSNVTLSNILFYYRDREINFSLYGISISKVVELSRVVRVPSVLDFTICCLLLIVTEIEEKNEICCYGGC